MNGQVYTIVSAPIGFVGTFINAANGATVNFGGSFYTINYTLTAVTATKVSFPTVSASTNNLAINAPSLIITGTAFDTNPANDIVALNSGTGTVTAATATQLTVTFATQPSLGNLTAVVTTTVGNSGTPVQVATVVPPPTTSSTANLAEVHAYDLAAGIVSSYFAYGDTPFGGGLFIGG